MAIRDDYLDIFRGSTPGLINNEKEDLAGMHLVCVAYYLLGSMH